MAKVAVVVPIYNTEDYLENCIESIINQSLQNIQIILVDDGSTDSSGKICDKYSRIDCRIIVLHQQNKGLAKSRIEGAKLANAEYITWIDGDDWIDEDYIEKLYSAIVFSEYDMVTSEISFEMGNSQSFIRSIYSYGEHDSKELKSTMIYTGCFFTYGLQPHMCSKLFKTNKAIEVFNCISSEVCAGEDALFTYIYVSMSNKINITNICGYHYVWRNGSLTNSQSPIDDLKKLRNLFNNLEEYFIGQGCYDLMYPQLVQYEKFHLLMRHIGIFDNDDNTILIPYGGISKDARVVIYGAGVIGQKIYNYLVLKKGVNVVYWVDRNDIFFKSLGYNVDNPENIVIRDEFDYIIIANTNNKIAYEIRTYLIEKGVKETKIKWFSNSFINPDYSCGILMEGRCNAFTG